jgi:hypothetical protein
LVTPGSDHAASSASWRSSQERTMPLRITSSPLVSIVVRLASTSALCLSASYIFIKISAGSARGSIATMLDTPFTPLIRRTVSSAPS